MEINFKDIQRLKLEDGDVLVVSAEQVLTKDQMQHIKGEFYNFFPNNKLIVLAGGLRLEIINNNFNEKSPYNSNNGAD